MDSRERTFMSLNFEEPDRVPVDLWLSSGFVNKIETRLGTTKEEFLDLHDVDLRYIKGPGYIGPPLKKMSGELDEDIWGVIRKRVLVQTKDGDEYYKEVEMSPLAEAGTVEEVNEYKHWPSPDWFDYSGIEAQCDEIRRQGRVVVFMGDRLNRLAQLKPAMYIRGIERIFIDMVMNPEIVEAIITNIRKFYIAYAERIFEAANGKLDILLTGDDFGSQGGPLVSPKMWEAFLGEGFAEYISLAKSYGIKVMHHTCGSVRPIIPMMADRGLDILQSLQPEAEGMNPSEIKREYGDRMSFQGGISIQKALPFGTPEDVRAEVRDRIEALAPGGGYIICTAHNIQADTTMENVQALLQAYKDFGKY